MDSKLASTIAYTLNVNPDQLGTKLLTSIAGYGKVFEWRYLFITFRYDNSKFHVSQMISIPHYPKFKYIHGVYMYIFFSFHTLIKVNINSLFLFAQIISVRGWSSVRMTECRIMDQNHSEQIRIRGDADERQRWRKANILVILCVRTYTRMQTTSSWCLLCQYIQV